MQSELQTLPVIFIVTCIKKCTLVFLFATDIYGQTVLHTNMWAAHTGPKILCGLHAAQWPFLHNGY